MSKFSKGCLITAGVFISVGLIMGLIISIIAGHSFINLVNNRTISWSNINMFGREWQIGRDGREDYYGNNLTINGDTISDAYTNNAIAGAQIEKLDLTIGIGNLEVTEWDLDTFGIEISGRGKCNYNVEGGTLYIDGFNNVKNNAAYNEIYLYVPKGQQYTNVKIDVGAGAAAIDGIKASKLICDVGMGRAVIDQVNLNGLEVSVGMGEAIIEGKVQGNIKTDCSMGRLSLTLEGRSDDYNYLVDCAMGQIEIENESFSMLAGERRINNGADYDLKANCSMGSIEIDFIR